MKNLLYWERIVLVFSIISISLISQPGIGKEIYGSIIEADRNIYTAPKIERGQETAQGKGISEPETQDKSQWQTRTRSPYLWESLSSTRQAIANLYISQDGRVNTDSSPMFRNVKHTFMDDSDFVHKLEVNEQNKVFREIRHFKAQESQSLKGKTVELNFAGYVDKLPPGVIGVPEQTIYPHALNYEGKEQAKLIKKMALDAGSPQQDFNDKGQRIGVSHWQLSEAQERIGKGKKIKDGVERTKIGLEIQRIYDEATKEYFEGGMVKPYLSYSWKRGKDGYLSLESVGIKMFLVSRNVVEKGKEALLRISEEEKSIIDEIVAKSSGKRIIIKDLLTPQKVIKRGESEYFESISSPTIVLLFEEDKNSGKPIIISKWLVSSLSSTESYQLRIPNLSVLSNGSVIFFRGEVILEGYTFKGDQFDPLSFVFVELREKGFIYKGLVYFKGKGSVVLKNGKIIKLPIN